MADIRNPEVAFAMGEELTTDARKVKCVITPEVDNNNKVSKLGTISIKMEYEAATIESDPDNTKQRLFSIGNQTAGELFDNIDSCHVVFSTVPGIVLDPTKAPKVMTITLMGTGPKKNLIH